MFAGDTPPQPIPVIDVFAGPGGLSEGFSFINNQCGQNSFDVRLSIEKHPVAHRTLTLRALFRAFGGRKVPDCYYDYLRGKITKEDLLTNPVISSEVQQSSEETLCATLGETPAKDLDTRIKQAINGQDPWVLIGGPPCQAYSIAGRSRRRGVDPDFEKDEKHFLYKEYLRIIRMFQPAIFVMENVKGLLSSTHGGSPIFERILADLSSPRDDLEYEIRSFVVAPGHGDLKPSDFIIESERYGVPQMRHRVILLGVRKDYAHLPHSILKEASQQVTLRDALLGLPVVRSRLSQETDSFENWLDAVSHAPNTLKGWKATERQAIEASMFQAIRRSKSIPGTGGAFLKAPAGAITAPSGRFGNWVKDQVLGGVCQHETRQHMRSDLHRYMFAACHLESFGRVPMIDQYPEKLLPKHKNVSLKEIPFKDRFRVQSWSSPSTTIVSHIAKDGHYYIHPDPAQCRSLTVREAARLQTFPDNYFFEGNRSEQYTQVGNAVPPYLAMQLGQIVAGLIDAARERTGAKQVAHYLSAA